MPALWTKLDEHREILFWLLLLGSWQFLTSPHKWASMIGAAGSVWFLVFAWKCLSRLRSFGMDHACWEPAPIAIWMLAVAAGSAAGGLIFGVGSATGENMMLSADLRLMLLQVALGPVLEEIVFRGYFFGALAWSFRRLAGRILPNSALIAVGDVVFAVVHLAQPGVRWLELASIASTGTLYGWIRCRSGSTAPAAASHAAYNLTLYVLASFTAILGRYAAS
jgi:membrane protease YdiL (CAAX protease family)